jgi:hypothetical protein
MDGRMIDRNAALGHHLLKIAQTQIISKVPAYAQKYHLSVELAALEHRNAPKIFDSFLAMLPVTKTLQQIPLRSSGAEYRGGKPAWRSPSTRR